MREHKDRHMVWRIVSPPSVPGITCRRCPRTPNRPKHIAAQNPGSDIFERTHTKIVVDTLGSVAHSPVAVLTVHLLKYFCLQKPAVQFHSSNAQRIINILARTGAEAVKRDGKGCNADFGHNAAFILPWANCKRGWPINMGIW